MMERKTKEDERKINWRDHMRNYRRKRNEKESEECRKARLDKERIAKKLKRDSLSCNEKVELNEKSRKRKSELRKNETDDAYIRRLDKKKGKTSPKDGNNDRL